MASCTEWCSVNLLFLGLESRSADSCLVHGTTGLLALSVLIWMARVLRLLNLVHRIACLLTLFWRSKFRWVAFHQSSAVIYQFILLGQFTETSTPKSSFDVGLKRIYISSVMTCTWTKNVENSSYHVHLFCKFGMTFTWTKNVEKSFCHDRHFPIIVRNELTMCWSQWYEC